MGHLITLVNNNSIHRLFEFFNELHKDIQSYITEKLVDEFNGNLVVTYFFR